MKEANHLEARSRFWELANSGVFSFIAGLGFSPDYCHANFSHKGHLPVSEFRKLLRDAQIEFKRPKLWRDEKNPARKKYRFRGRKMTLDQAISEAGADITAAAVRSRLKTGWKLEEAITKPVKRTQKK